MATVQKYVNTASAGGDGSTNNTSGATAAYASLASWESNAGGVATDDYIVDCCGTAADTTAVTVDFAVNITTGSITIRGNRSDDAGFYSGGAVISTSHYRLTPGDVAIALSAVEDKTTVDGIQIIAGHTTSNGSAIRPPILTGAGTSFTVRNNRLLNSASTFVGIGSTADHTPTLELTIENNLVVGFADAFKLPLSTHRSPTVTIQHNTFYGNGSSDGIDITQTNGSGTPVFNIKANAIGNNGSGVDSVTSVNEAQATFNFQDNAWEGVLGTAGEIAIGTLTDAWTSPGTSTSSDFTVKDASSTLYNAVNPTLLSEDITEFTRDGTNHDVGAFEFQSGGGVTANASGSSATVTAGTVQASGGASVEISGASATGQAGTVQAEAAGNAQANLSGASSTSNAGTLQASGGASVSITGNQATSQIGTLTAEGAGDGAATANVSGVQASSGVGSLTVQGTSTVTLSGVSASGTAGDVEATSAMLAPTTGVQATGQVGSVSITADALASIVGVVSTASTGDVTSSIPDATVQLSGISMTGHAGALLAGISPGKFARSSRASNVLTKTVRKAGTLSKGVFPS